MSSLLADARAGKGPGGRVGGPVASAITIALGFPTGDRVSATNDLATALATARSGDTNLLTSLINRAEATDRHRRTVRQLLQRRDQPPHARTGSANWWSRGRSSIPQFGTVGALNLVKCVHWPTGSPPPPPKVLKVDVLSDGRAERPDRRDRRRLGRPPPPSSTRTRPASG